VNPWNSYQLVLINLINILPPHWFNNIMDKENDGFPEANLIVESVSHASETRCQSGGKIKPNKLSFTTPAIIHKQVLKIMSEEEIAANVKRTNTEEKTLLS